jgi:hypothetical protein
MIRMRRPGTVCRITAVSLITALVFCEFLVYYITLYSCDYPEQGERRGEDELRVMVLADTHLLGNLQCSWTLCFKLLRQDNITV